MSHTIIWLPWRYFVKQKTAFTDNWGYPLRWRMDNNRMVRPRMVQRRMVRPRTVQRRMVRPRTVQRRRVRPVRTPVRRLVRPVKPPNEPHCAKWTSWHKARLRPLVQLRAPLRQRVWPMMSWLRRTLRWRPMSIKKNEKTSLIITYFLH